MREDQRRPLADQVQAQADRKLRARHARPAGAWTGLGMMGMIGWSVSVPALLGVALGAWLDKQYPGAHAWTLALLVAGLVLGCFSAWRWVDQEQRAMHQGRDDHA
ncbi:MAG: AtpZ/AtpI family protein [Pseudomonadota bacterium]|nr:AtpZ/AtpI family protein [Pseudomonadota bacterium]